MAGAEARRVETGETDRNSRGDRTRKLIKTTIAKLAARRDVSEITLADICKAAKLTTGALYFHFKSKEDAVEEMIIDEIAERYRTILKDYKGGDFNTLVALSLEKSTEFHQKKGRLVRAIPAIINSSPRAYQSWLDCRRPLIARFEQAIAETRAARHLPTEQAPYLAHIILNSMEDLAMDVFQWKNPTLAPFADTLENWNRRQTALWTWAILSPMPL